MRRHLSTALLGLALLLLLGVAGAADARPLTLGDLPWLALAAVLGHASQRIPRPVPAPLEVAREAQ